MVMVWTGAHCAFAVEMFFKTKESLIGTESFRAHIMYNQNDAVLDRIFNYIILI